MFKQLLFLCVASSAACGIASASPLTFSVSGQFSNSDVSGMLVAPNGIFSLVFSVDSNPAPLTGTVTSLGFDVPVNGFSYKLNNSLVSATASEIRFNTLGNGGLFDVTFGSGLTAEEFDFEGPQLFTGSTAAPVFSAGSFIITDWTFSDPANFDSQTPRSSTVSVLAAPEPSSVFLLAAGFIAFIGLNFRKSGRSRKAA